MSHFSVLVIGKNWEEQLKPFDENLEVPRYIEYTKKQLIKKGKDEITHYATKGLYAEFIKDPVKYVAGMKEINTSEDVLKNGHLKHLMFEFPERLHWTDEQIYQHELEYIEKENIGPKGEIYSEYNPKSKWDWYEMGGRFAGKLFLKEGVKKDDLDKPIPNFSWGWDEKHKHKVLQKGSVDQAPKKFIDFTKMHKAADKMTEDRRFWELKVEGATPQTEEEKEGLKFDWYNKEYYIKRYGSKERYAELNASFHTWAVVKDGEWYEIGSMGWWGLSDESDDAATKWEEGYYEQFIAPLPESTLLTIVDCHI